VKFLTSSNPKILNLGKEYTYCGCGRLKVIDFPLVSWTSRKHYMLGGFIRHLRVGQYMYSVHFTGYIPVHARINFNVVI
jgi:hypothetical protein